MASDQGTWRGDPPGSPVDPVTGQEILDAETLQIVDLLADRVVSRLGGRVMPSGLPPEVCELLAQNANRALPPVYAQLGSDGIAMHLTIWPGGILHGELRTESGWTVWRGEWGPAGG